MPLKTCKHGDEVLRISQEFPENYSGEILRNFLGKNSEEFLRNFSKLSLKTAIHKNLSSWGPILGNFSRNSSEILQRKSPRLENLGKFFTFVTWETNVFFFYLTQSNFNIFRFCKLIWIQVFNSVPMIPNSISISKFYLTILPLK